MPRVRQLVSDYGYLSDFEFMNDYKAVKTEYENLRTFVKEKMEGESDKKMDRHKVAAAFIMAIAKVPQFRTSKKKYDTKNLNNENQIEFLLKMNCNKLGQYIVDYVLAWKAGYTKVFCH